MSVCLYGYVYPIYTGRYEQQKWGTQVMQVLETERLVIRQLRVEDAEFILKLLNEPGFIQNIGDRGVRTAADAEQYILNGPVASYQQNGFGLWLVALKESGEPLGMCGLIKRDILEDVDIGYAYLHRFWGKGYAYEAALAVLHYGRDVIRLKRLVAITAPENPGSIRVLEKLGLRFVKMINLPGYDEESRFFVIDF